MSSEREHLRLLLNMTEKEIGTLERVYAKDMPLSILEKLSAYRKTRAWIEQRIILLNEREYGP